MQRIGFSTGALAKGDVALGVEMARKLKLKVIELSALRLRELDALLTIVAAEDLSDFEHVAVHAPTDFGAPDEKDMAATLAGIAQERKWPVVVHPDTVSDFDHWRSLDSWLYVENMDKRKPRGRTVEELRDVIALVPKAHICFDIAHARQVDSSMTEAFRLLRHFRSIIRQIHFSEVGSDSRHRQVSDSAFRAYSEVAQSIPDVPVILETVIPEGPSALATAAFELERVSRFLTDSAHVRAPAV
jgi:hypothetical protein